MKNIFVFIYLILPGGVNGFYFFILFVSYNCLSVAPTHARVHTARKSFGPDSVHA